MRVVLNLVPSSIKMLVLSCVAGGHIARFAYLLENKCTFNLLVLLRCACLMTKDRTHVIQSVWALPSLLNHTSAFPQELEEQLLVRLMFLIMRLCRW